jgi:hypothetical protein
VGNVEYQFGVEKEARKALVSAISEITGEKAVYMRAPSLAYSVGGHNVSRHGTLTANGASDETAVVALAERLAEYGFTRETVRDNICGDNGGLVIEMPISGFTETALDNLDKIVATKAEIIKRMVGANELPIARTAETLRFGWFKATKSAGAVNAYVQLVDRLCEAAKGKRRVTASAREIGDGESPRYRARCFLLYIGFIGPEFALARQLFLAPFGGNGSFLRGGGRRKVDLDEHRILEDSLKGGG